MTGLTATKPESRNGPSTDFTQFQQSLEKENERLEKRLKDYDRTLKAPDRRNGGGGKGGHDADCGAKSDHLLEQEIRIAKAALATVGLALDRIKKGIYGICQECGDPIPKARLIALPSACWCVECQTTRENGEKSVLLV